MGNLIHLYKDMWKSIAVCMLLGLASSKQAIFDNNIPGSCTVADGIVTTNTSNIVSTETGTPTFEITNEGNKQGKITGTVKYKDGKSATAEGEWRFKDATFTNAPETTKYAYYKPEHTMFWSETYDDGKIYYYTGQLKDDGTFEGSYNSADDAAELNANIEDPEAKNSGTVKMSGVTCTLKSGAEKIVIPEDGNKGKDGDDSDNESDKDKDDDDNTGAMVGGIVGGMSGCIFGVFGYCMWKKKKAEREGAGFASEREKLDA